MIVSRSAWRLAHMGKFEAACACTSMSIWYSEQEEARRDRPRESEVLSFFWARDGERISRFCCTGTSRLWTRVGLSYEFPADAARRDKKPS